MAPPRRLQGVAPPAPPPPPPSSSYFFTSSATVGSPPPSTRPSIFFGTRRVSLPYGKGTPKLTGSAFGMHVLGTAIPLIPVLPQAPAVCAGPPLCAAYVHGKKVRALGRGMT